MSRERGVFILKIKIKEMRKKKGITQKELAEKLNVYQVDISEWENTDRMPSVKNLTEIALALDLTLEELVEYREIQGKISDEYTKMINEKEDEN